MNRFFLIIVSISILSCKGHLTPEQQKQNNTAEALRKRDSIAAPLIANDIADLNNAIAGARNKNLQPQLRQSYMDYLRKNFVEYMGYAVSPETYTGKPALTYFKDDAGLELGRKIMLDSVFSKRFDTAVQLQKQLIKSKWNYYAA